MKIIAISALPLWVMGGQKGLPTIYYAEKGFVDAGHEVHFITPDLPLWRTKLDEEWQKKPKEENYEGIQVHRFSIPFLPHLRRLYLGKLPSQKTLRCVKRAVAFCSLSLLVVLFTARALQTAFHVAAVCKPNVVYAHNGIAAAAAYILAKRRRIPNVTRLYGTFLSQIRWSTPHLLLHFPEVLGFKIPCTYLIVTNDGTQGDQVAARLGVPQSRVKFWVNGVDRGMYDPTLTIEEAKRRIGVPPEKRLVLTLNRLDRWKRIDRLIEAVPDLIALYPNVLVLIVGDGIERDNLVRLSSTLGVGNYVKFTGAVPHTNVTDYMHAADVFVSTQDATNFGNHLLEAMVCGRCIVTLNNGDTGNFITNNDNGILLEPDDLRSLPTAIAKLLHDDVLRKQLGDGALRYARQNFQTWDERMRTEVKLIEDLVGRAPGLA